MKLQLRKAFVCLLVLGSALLLMGASTDGEPQAPPSPESFPSKVVWTADGRYIIFSRGLQGIFMVDVAGSELRAIPEGAPLKKPLSPGNALPALSPDGTRIAYVAQQSGLGKSAAITVSALDGTSGRRLTQDEKFNTHPAWSPDGTRIAYIADGRLTVMRADGTNARVLAPFVEVVNAAPEWSPDGRRIAFVGIDNDPTHPNAVYTVRPDGTELTKLGATVSVPSWSPDGSRIAFLMPEESGEVSLYTLDSGGADPQQVWSLGETSIWADNLSWSPDGSAILFASADGEVVAISTEDVEEKVLFRTAGRWAAWSADGSRTAVLMGLYGDNHTDAADQEVLYTTVWDGRFRRVLVEGNEERLVAKHPGWYDVSRNIAACAEGYVVSDPTAEGFVVARPFENAGLVEDCEILLAIRDKLAGDFLLNWGNEIPITEWWGVATWPYSWGGGGIDRVFALWFVFPIYVDYASTTSQIFVLMLYASGPYLPSLRDRDTEDGLSGSIPPELGALSGLRWIDLSHNELSGSIPPELGALSGLRWIDLSHNELSGSIPPELGNITGQVVDVSGLGRINIGPVLLSLAKNKLSGSIPPELANLTSLEFLNLSDNNLSGSIPPELGAMRNLKELHLQGNALTGCVPAALSSEFITIETDGLQFCAE